MTKPFSWNNAQKMGFLIVLASQSQAFSSSDFQYFNSEIDYWNSKPSTAPNAEKKALSSEVKATETAETPGTFSWQKYLDPKNKEFFKEGEYTPPEPFMEIVRNPTDSNLKNWFTYIDKKNELTRKLQERMQEYLSKNAPTIETVGKDTMKARLASLPITEPDAKRFRFRMYFDSHCPHCKKMFGTLSELQSRGFYVEAKQIDSDPKGLEGAGIPTSRATPGEIQEKDIQSVPVLLIGDLEKKTVFRLTGYQSTANVFAAIGQSK